jgi:hypothetical protein
VIEILFILVLALIVIVVARAGVENADAPDEGMKAALRKWILLVLGFALIFVPLISVPILRNPAFSALPVGLSIVASAWIALRVDIEQKPIAMLLGSFYTMMWIFHGFMIYNLYSRHWYISLFIQLWSELIVVIPLQYAATVYLIRWARFAL